MLRYFAFLTFVLFVKAEVDYNDCQIVEGWYGDYTDCPPDHVAIGACGSGAKADCSNNYHTMECCRYITPTKEEKVEAPAERKSCNIIQGGYGENIECTAYQGITTLCTSGLHESCGGGSGVTAISCCDFEGLSADYCTWRGGDWGEYVDCGPGSIMQGYCGSGDRYDCDGESHQVKCCILQ